MNVQYVAPLQRAWARMKTILFDPFDFGKWLAIGFAAWLARLAGGGGGGGMRLGPRSGHEGVLHLRRLVRGIWEHLRAHPHWLALIVAGAMVVALIGILLLWLSSRGKFVFLDNVVHNHARIGEPWRRYGRLGDSLFLWRLGFVVFCLLSLAALAALALLAAGGFSRFGFANARAGMITIMTILMVALWGVACAYVSLFLDSFVVPLMYREGIGAIEAWRRFAPWIERYFGAFVLYGLFVLALAVVVGTCVIIVGLMTCCIGLLLVVLPYVGTVVLLPLLVTYRALSLEFLAQLDPGFAIFPSQAEPPSPSPA